MGLFGNRHIPLLGLDISAAAVKLLEIGKSGDRYRVEAYAVEPLPPNSVVEKAITDEAAVGEAIRRAVSRSGTRLKHAAVAVAGSAVITKVIPMPAAEAGKPAPKGARVEVAGGPEMVVYRVRRCAHGGARAP